MGFFWMWCLVLSIIEATLWLFSQGFSMKLCICLVGSWNLDLGWRVDALFDTMSFPFCILLRNFSCNPRWEVFWSIIPPLEMNNIAFLDMEEMTWVASFGKVKAKIQDLKVILR